MPGHTHAAPVVMKFGGSSVATLDHLRTVAHVVADRAARQPVVCVVSAMGGTTDDLLARARALCPEPPARELDMLLTTGERQSMALLALALAGLGCSAVSLTGSQCGIITDHRHGQARVIEVRPFRIQDELAAGRVVIVGGFQGVSYRRDVTTIGRGGSDTSAVALAAALGADCEIYSDVDGVYDADPRVVPEARRIGDLDYRQMQAMARAGAKVLHAQAVALAAEGGIAIYARRTDGTGGETVVRANPRSTPVFRAVASEAPVVLIEHTPAPGTAVTAALESLAAAGLQHLRIDDAGVRGVLCPDRVADPAAARRHLDALPGTTRSTEDLALVSAVGTEPEGQPRALAAAARALTGAAIPALAAITDSHALAFLVPGDQEKAAVRALHGALLGEPGPGGATA